MNEFGPAIERGCSIWDASEDRPVWLTDFYQTVWTKYYIRLPADHFAYTVMRWNDEHPGEVPFYPWRGGDDAPRDWDDGNALVRSGKISTPNQIGQSGWIRGYAGDPERYAHHDVIGYRRKPQLTQQSATPVNWSKPIEAVHEDGRIVPVALDLSESDQPDEDGDYTIHPRFDEDATRFYGADGISHNGVGGWRIRNVAANPDLTAIAQDAANAAGMVAVKALPESELRHRGVKAFVADPFSPVVSAYIQCAVDLGIIRPEPTQAERLHKRFPHISVADIEALLGETGK